MLNVRHSHENYWLNLQSKCAHLGQCHKVQQYCSTCTCIKQLWFTIYMTHIKKQDWILWIYAFMSGILEKNIPHLFCPAVKPGLTSMDIWILRINRQWAAANPVLIHECYYMMLMLVVCSAVHATSTTGTLVLVACTALDHKFTLLNFLTPLLEHLSN
jgi:hypothetical protein